jgi:hypothetical protein
MITSDAPIENYFVGRKAARAYIGGEEAVLRRMIHWSSVSAPNSPDRWLDLAGQRGKGRGRKTLIVFTSLQRAAQRLLAGEEPKLLPYEEMRK